MKKISSRENLLRYFNSSFRSLVFASIFTLTTTNAFTQSSVDLVIDPVNVQVNDVFTVDVKVDFGTGSLSLVETYINFNTLDLEVQSTPVVPAGTQAELPNVSVAFNSVANMNSTGFIDYGRFTTDPDFGTHPDADFTFFTITFRALRVPPGGTTTLTFNTATPRVTAARETTTFDALDETISGVFTISAAGCTVTPSVNISAPGGSTTCNSQDFNLLLASASAGTGPFDLTIEGPDGTATYNDIAVGDPITTFSPPVLSVWSNPAPPTWDDVPYTLGLKFTSSTSGFVKGVRFFSSDEVSTVPGNYTGQLWTADGTLITSGTFANVTAGSWQELLFASPVLITPGTIYIASYNMGTATTYASTSGGLAADFTNGPLTALGNGGVYAAGSTPTPPFASVQGNYWVDVLFSPNQYAFNLTSVKDALECINTGALQTLSITSVDCSALPVSLLNLSATPKDNTIILNWSTALEINNDGFEIQRKTESGNWSAIGFVKGAGNSYSTRNYNYTDEKLSPTRYYYRLKQIDIDGKFEYSPVVSAIIGGTEKFTLEQNYPNPFRGETVVRFSLPQKTNVKLTMFDMHGRLVKTLVNGSKEKGTHAVTVNSSTLTSGLYYYKLETENFSAVKKMTIQ